MSSKNKGVVYPEKECKVKTQAEQGKYKVINFIRAGGSVDAVRKEYEEFLNTQTANGQYKLHSIILDMYFVFERS